MKFTIILDKLSRHDKPGKLISGWAGQVFDSMLHPLTRDELNIVLLQDYDSSKDTSDVVLALGQACIDVIYPEGKVTLNEQRGCPVKKHGKIYIFSYPPQDALDRKNYFGQEESKTEKFTEKGHQNTQRHNWKYWLNQDLAKVKRLAKDGKPEDCLKHSIHTCPPVDLVLQCLDNCPADQPITLDIETDANLNLTCFAIGSPAFGKFVNPWATDQAFYSLVLLFKGSRSYSDFETVNILRSLIRAFKRNTIITHNGSFDLLVLCWRYKVPFPSRIRDTMLMHHRMEPEIEKSLGHCVSLYTDLPFHKNEGVFDPKNITQENQLMEYNAKDIYTTYLIHNKILKEAEHCNNLASVEQANRMIRPHLTATYQGIRIDLDKLNELYNKYDRLEKQYERILSLLTKQKLNPRSPKQVCEYLYYQLGNKQPKKDATNERSLLSLYNKKEIPSIKVILKIRQNRKLKSALDFPLWYNGRDLEEGRLTTSFGIAGTDTLRLSSKTLFKFPGTKSQGYGTNVQNWKKANREVVVPDKGKILFQVDQSGAEAMMVAWLCRPGRYRLLFKNGIKPHVYIAMHLFHQHWATLLGLPDIDYLLQCPITDLRKQKYFNELENLIKGDALKYAVGKMVCHASNYDMKAPTFQMQAMVKSNNELILTLKECRFYLGTYHSLFVEVRDSYQEGTKELLHKGRELRNLFGFRRKFYGFFGDDLYKQGYAFRPQSSSGCLSHQVFVQIQEDIDSGGFFKEAGVDVLQNGHDSILGQCNESEGEKVCAEVCKLFNVTFQGYDEPFTMKSEYGLGYNWKPHHEKTNPNGMKEV